MSDNNLAVNLSEVEKSSSISTLYSLTSNSVGKVVIVKFFDNLNTCNTSNLITKTLMKVGFIDRAFIMPENRNAPRSGEFWKVRIVGEMNPGEGRGCFLLEPLKQVLITDICKLLQGMYTEELKDNILFIHPNDSGHNFVLPLSHKRSISNTLEDIYSVLVCL